MPFKALASRGCLSERQKREEGLPSFLWSISRLQNNSVYRQYTGEIKQNGVDEPSSLDTQKAVQQGRCKRRGEERPDIVWPFAL